MTLSRSIKTQKVSWPISSRLGRTSVVKKGFIIWSKRDFLACLTYVGTPKWVRWAHLAHSESRIHFIFQPYTVINNGYLHVYSVGILCDRTKCRI